MTTPTNRAEFKKWCLRRLGAPVLEINVDEDQVDDCVDEALQYYRDYHFDGTERTYLKHQITQTDIDNEYITVPEQIFAITSIYPVSSYYSSGNLFNLHYQISLNEVWDWSSSKLNYYTTAMDRLALLQEILVGRQTIRFNRHTNKLYVDMDWSDKLVVGEYLLFDCYAWLDPDTYVDVWNDMWLKRYATALIKRCWGNNLKKFSGLQLPGGVTMNGQVIYDEAVIEIKQMEDEMIGKYSLPIFDLLG